MAYLELWKAMTALSVISPNPLPFLPPLLPSSPGQNEKGSTCEITLKKLCFGQKSPGLNSILIQSADIGCPRGAGYCPARLGVMLGLRDDPVCFFSLLEMGTVPESFQYL